MRKLLFITPLLCLCVSMSSYAELTFHFDGLKVGAQGNFPHEDRLWYSVDALHFTIGSHPFLFGTELLGFRINGSQKKVLDGYAMDLFPLCLEYIILGRKYRDLFPLYAYMRGNAWRCGFVQKYIENNDDKIEKSNAQYIDLGIAMDGAFRLKHFKEKMYMSLLNVHLGVLMLHINKSEHFNKKTVITAYANVSIAMSMWYNWNQSKKYKNKKDEKEPQWD